MIARRLATISAAIGLVAAVVAPFRVFSVFVANSGHGPGILGLWMLVPIAAAIVALAAVRTQSSGLVWGAVGAAWGFVIIAAWSLGTFFVGEAFALLLAGILHVIAVQARWRTLLVPLWLIAGATTLCPLFLAADAMRWHGQGGYVTHAPIIIWGCWAFVAALTVLGIVEAVSRAGQRRVSASR